MKNLKTRRAGLTGVMILIGAFLTMPTAFGQQARTSNVDAPSTASIERSNLRFDRLRFDNVVLDRTATPDLGACPSIEAPAGNRLSFSVYAEGVQVYRWNGSSWTFVMPDAVLFADNGENGIVGTHYAGPTWESNSGSRVVGSVLERCTPDANAIPWLLLQAVYTEGPGIFHNVTYIQRVNTVGGLAPTDPGTTPGEIARIPYTADYLFYRAE